MTQIEIQTRDGLCPAYVFRPEGAGPWPAVIVYMDAVAIRPAMLAVGERLASYGYFVLVPDLFYRSGPYAPMNPQTLFSDPENFKNLREKYMDPASPEAIMSDTQSFLSYLAAQPDVAQNGVGVTGYCFGGGMALRAAATYPEQIKAAASYHGGRLATDAPDSPHLLAPQIKASVYVGGAIEDSSFPDDMKARLETALTEAGVDHQIETYPAKHGWVISDMPVYDAGQAERHWETLTGLLAKTL